jgi:hypothetical protein
VLWVIAMEECRVNGFVPRVLHMLTKEVFEPPRLKGRLRRTSDGPQLKWFVGGRALFGMATYPTPAQC